ncbi:Crp/Fnr family transcriptional regulator [Rickettsiales bacterium]|nr:Crp/Fnr family transcriptional regulator [Rickettsiales bacterium]
MEKLLEKSASQGVLHKFMQSKEAYRSFLKRMPLFCEFSETCLSEVLANSRIKHHKKGDILFMTGDNAQNFRIIVNGWIKLYRETRDGHEAVVSVLTNNEVFGKTAILSKGTYAYTAEAITDTEMLMIPAAFMLKMAEHKDDYDHFLAKFLEEELNDSNQLGLHAEHLGQMTSAERVGCFLLRLCSIQKEGSITFQLPYEKALVAGKLGMTAETFSRSLNQLITRGVETKNSVVTIHNIEQLRTHICEHCSATTLECPLGAETETI